MRPGALRARLGASAIPISCGADCDAVLAAWVAEHHARLDSVGGATAPRVACYEIRPGMFAVRREYRARTDYSPAETHRARVVNRW